MSAPPADPTEVRMRSSFRLAVALVLVATPVFASYGSKPDLPQPATSSNDSPATDASGQTARQRAEPWYRDAWGDVMKGSKELERGNKPGAEKKFRRALERSHEAVSLDSSYAEAWNLIGFTSRKLGDYPGS